jgi:hypothetical protein
MYTVSVMHKHRIVYCSTSHILYSFQIALTSLVGDYSTGKRPLSSTHGSGKSHRIRRFGRPAPGHTGRHGHGVLGKKPSCDFSSIVCSSAPLSCPKYPTICATIFVVGSGHWQEGVEDM